MPEGLSPRVRGSLDDVAHRQQYPGSIPACAGEPWARPGSPRRPGVYPRVCGGAAEEHADHGSRPGLSPRVRGSRSRQRRRHYRRGSIPACAGEPVKKTDIEYARGVYPRVCGGARSRLATHARE